MCGFGGGRGEGGLAGRRGESAAVQVSVLTVVVCVVEEEPLINIGVLKGVFQKSFVVNKPTQWLCVPTQCLFVLWREKP